MNKYAKTFLGALVVLVPSVIILGLLFNNISKKSFYPTSGEIEVSGLNSAVNVYFDGYGVPHILASNENDAYFTLGYMHAQDRLWQMDLMRRVAEGRLSEIFGSNSIEFDKLFRTIGISRFCYSWYNSISPKSKQILDAYAYGVNKFIETYYYDLPVEFDALNYKPEPWKPEQSLMLGRLMGWDLNIAWYTDYVLGEVVNKVGLEKASEIFPDTNITIFKKTEQETPEDTVEADELGSVHYFQQVASLGKDFFNINLRYREFFNLNGSHTGSNSWVVSGEKSEYGKPIIANDPHLALQAPSKWYEAYIKGGNLDVRGMTLPGVPAVIIGNNKDIAWGLTNLMNDDNDFIILGKDSLNENKYIYYEKSLYLDSLKEKIYVKDSMEVDFVIKTTKSGPVISNLSTKGFADNSPPNTQYQNKILTFKWTGFELSDEVNSFYKINTAKNWDGFRNGLKDFGTPAQNFLFADINGNIGYQAAGKIPIRKTSENNSPIFPTEALLEWTEFVEFEKLLNIYNPKEGYIVTANTNPYDWLKGINEKYYISYLWEPSSRFNKINEFIQSKTISDIDEYKLLQNNYESPFARETVKYIVEAYKSLSPQDNNIKWCIERFNGWNGEMKANESIGSVYNAFLTYLIKNIFEDELGAEVFNNFLIIQNIPYRSLELILRKNDNPWFDKNNTQNFETRDEIIRLSLQQAIEFLKTKFVNQDINKWNWGELHKVKFIHPFGRIEAMDKTFNIGPFDIGGDQTTVNNSEYHFDDVLKDGSFPNIVGPTMRMIVNLADIEHPLTMNSTGQSGQPLHENYSDQSRMWLYGEYKDNTMNEMEMLGRNYKLLTLIPKN
ncbi:MAG: penicillin acylase family protein [Chlorobi bacterium]|nr:penicillin acylase family protein [Chlorobiota bacterium]MCI0716817.1 penicillin acylase family protein [Chlorobiota bacterium]